MCLVRFSKQTAITNQNIVGCYLEWKGSDFCEAWTGFLNIIRLQSVNKSHSSNFRLQSVNKSHSSNPSPTAILPIYGHRSFASLWQYVECSGTSKCGEVWNFCLLTFLRAEQGWRYIGGWLHVLLCGLPIFFGKFAKLRKATVSHACPSVPMNNAAPTKRNFMKSDICRENSNFTKIWQE